MDSTDTAPDFIGNPDDDLADVIGDNAGLVMKFESDEEVDNYRDYEKWLLWRNTKTLRNRLINKMISYLNEVNMIIMYYQVSFRHIESQ